MQHLEVVKEILEENYGGRGGLCRDRDGVVGRRSLSMWSVVDLEIWLARACTKYANARLS